MWRAEERGVGFYALTAINGDYILECADCPAYGNPVTGRRSSHRADSRYVIASDLESALWGELWRRISG